MRTKQRRTWQDRFDAVEDEVPVQSLPLTCGPMCRGAHVSMAVTARAVTARETGAAVEVAADNELPVTESPAHQIDKLNTSHKPKLGIPKRKIQNFYKLLIWCTKCS